MKLLSPDQAIEYLTHVEHSVYSGPDGVIFAMDFGGLKIQSERPGNAGSCYTNPPSFWLIDQDEFDCLEVVKG